MTDILHIAFGFDQNYLIPCGVTLISICENTPCSIHFHAIISDDVREVDRKQIKSIVEKYGNKISFYAINENLFGDLRENAHITRSTYNRFLIPALLPIEINKVLYLDTDLIVLKSLEPLWNEQLNVDEPVAMAIDARCSSVRPHNAINIPLSQIYYNAGVMLMNLDCWRKENISRQCIDAIAQNHYPWMDQDAMNVVIGTRIKKIHLKFNLQMVFMRNSEEMWDVEKGLYFDEVNQAKADPVILHYSQIYKPWQVDYPYPEEWLFYKNKSPWKDEPLGEKPYEGTNSIWMCKEAYQEDCKAFENDAPVYFFVFQKTVKKHKCLYWMIKKILKLVSLFLH